LIVTANRPQLERVRAEFHRTGEETGCKYQRFRRPASELFDQTAAPIIIVTTHTTRAVANPRYGDAQSNIAIIR